MFRHIELISLFLIILNLAGCGSGISGEYGGDNCIYDLNFESGGKVYMSVTFFGQKSPETAGTYEVDDDRVIVTSPDGKNIVFTKEDDSLVSDLLGDKMECKKL